MPYHAVPHHAIPCHTILRYVGDMVGGRMEGRGEMTWPGGDKYIGDWSNNQR